MMIYKSEDDEETVVFVDGTKPPSARRLTEAEERFFQEWTGGMLVIVNSVEEALEVLKNCVSIRS
jgi:hypothetical protein